MAKKMSAHTKILGESMKADLLAMLDPLAKYLLDKGITGAGFDLAGNHDVHIYLSSKKKLPSEITCVLDEYGCIYIKVKD